ncbi:MULTISPECIES: UMP kinase [unclassified Sphaerochaeta]|jgi:uridylate kinase|uniref:UMP kinase n=1 Tax=unclassified Sphaerochaeta TaxID=2637943 RepID=UPI000EDC558C|nr:MULTISPECIES: UMP kinase [unclassified Sphaerochaeta]MDX9825150.1 UMP kinase [Sphaerochaeta sp.]HCU30686.1 UMP kinase [Sphaerochaeta sp.]
MNNLAVISLGGSIIAPDKVDTAFLRQLNEALRTYLIEDRSRKIILVCGGGSPARVYQQAMREIREDVDSEELDWLGIRATHINGQLVKAMLSEFCTDNLITDPTGHINFRGQVLVAAGWKPGFSTDNDAVILAERFEGRLIINLSNIAKVYTDDPKKNPDAKPLDSISWADYRTMVGNQWTPGKSTPFDPIASKRAEKMHMKVVCADGRNIRNTMDILYGRPFLGTVIGDENA